MEDRYVAFFAGNEYIDFETREDVYIHKFAISVTPRAEKGEEGWFKPYWINLEVPNMPVPIYKAAFYPASYDKGGNMVWGLLSLVKDEEGRKSFYGRISYVNHIKGETNSIVGKAGPLFKDKNLKFKDEYVVPGE